VTSVHPTAVIGPGVQLGTGVVIAPYAVLSGPCRVGDDVWIGPHTAIGTPAQMRGGAHPEVAGPRLNGDAGAGVVIGRDTVVREFVTIHQGVERATEVGADCFLMAYAHVPHDAWLGRGVTLSNSVQLGGHTWIGPGANIGLGAVVHQRSTIGAHAMVGMQSAVTKPVPPFSVAVGVPARVTGVNRVGIERLGIDGATADAWHELLRSGETAGDAHPDLGEHVVRYRRALHGAVIPAVP
jgi:UDP-N-acetylglucosamine acyltransferase